MILEEIIGDAVCVIVRETGGTATLAVGDYFSDHERGSLTVTGSGKVIIRVDPNCTMELCGVEPEVTETTVEEVMAPVIQQMAVTDTVAATEAPVIVFPAKTAE